MNWSQPQYILSFIRHLITLAGGVLIARGWADDSQIAEAAGALCTLVAIGFSIANKRDHAKLVNALIDNGPTAGAPPPNKPTPLPLLLALCLPLILLAGCATGPGQYTPRTNTYDAQAPADTLVVTCEKVRATALDTFDAIMQWEYANREALQRINPQIHEFAENIRRNGRAWLDDLTALKRSYQDARTPDNASRLNAALAALNSAIASASRYLATNPNPR